MIKMINSPILLQNTTDGTGTGTSDGTQDSLAALSALTLGDWLWAGGLVLAAIVLAVVGKRITQKLVSARADDLVARLLGRLVALAIAAVGFVYALNQVGVSIAPLLGILGLLGLALAFAFQEILENFIAGILMSLRRPITAGDQVTTAGHSGTVEDINLRAVELKTYSGERVYIPNAMVWKDVIVNHTELGPRRTTLDVGVDYDADLDTATASILDAVGRVSGVLDDPGPEAFVHGFGGSSIDIAIRFWHEPQKAVEWQVRDAVAKEVKKALDEVGIGIPFPQRVVTFTNAPGDAA